MISFHRLLKNSKPIGIVYKDHSNWPDRPILNHEQEQKRTKTQFLNYSR